MTTTLTRKEREFIYDLTVNIMQKLKSDDIVRVTNKEIRIYKSTNKKDPQNTFISIMKTYANNYGIPYEEDEHVFNMKRDDFIDFYVCNALSED